MKQLIQNFKSGELFVDEVPLPSLSEGYVLVANHFSLISAGTEKSTVSTGQASLLGKARKRPDLVKQVIQNYRKEGLKATIDKVRTKLDSLKALGYSTAGVVLASMDTARRFSPGDLVACGGQDYASHAEVVCVPQNLVAKIPAGVSPEEASFTTLGAIALQGIRQAEPQLGENICVIGLGLLGQITCQLLKANGCNVFGIDISPAMVQYSRESQGINAMMRTDENLLTAAGNFSGGIGFDKVIITAGAYTNDPVELSGQILRKKGRVVVVGAVKMDLPRDPDYYRKELDLRMSCSYGPGRYDPEYEEYGHDYPPGYVRWTEQRNMEAFLQQIAAGNISLKPMITHIFDIKDALKAYDLILGKVKERHVGILLKYPSPETISNLAVEVKTNPVKDLNAAFIGAGSFAQSYLIPNARDLFSLDTVVTRTGINANSVARKFGFSKSSTEPSDVLKNNSINTVFIATQHDTHASYVLEAMKAGKNVFVEKPLAVNDAELDEIISLYNEGKHAGIMVGFNRRFSSVAVEAGKSFKNTGEPLIMNFRVNAGFIPLDHWTQTKAGAGRIIGEMCHFFDLMQFLTSADPVRVFAECLSSGNDKMKNDDNISVVVKFNDGSVGNLVYAANGDKSLPKEHLEIFGGNSVFIIDDFKSGKLYKAGKVKDFKNQGKGHREEINAFYDALKKGQPSPISFRSVCLTTRTTFRILDSLATGLPIEVKLHE